MPKCKSGITVSGGSGSVDGGDWVGKGSGDNTGLVVTVLAWLKIRWQINCIISGGPGGGEGDREDC